MNVVIAGVNSQGVKLATALKSFRNSITMIGHWNDITSNTTDDINMIIGDICDPDVLKQVDVRESPVFIATTESDLRNVVACKLAKDVLKAKTTVAYINDDCLYKTKYSELLIKETFGIDYLVNKPYELANKTYDLICYGDISDYVLVNGFTIIELYCKDDVAVANTQIRHIKTVTTISITVLSISRDNEQILFPDDDERILVNDKLYIAFQSENIREIMHLFHTVGKFSGVLIIGSNHVTNFLLKKMDKNIDIKIAAHSSENIDQLPCITANSKVYDFTRIQDLSVIDFSDIDTVIAVTYNDEINIMSSLVTNIFRANRSIVSFNSDSFSKFALQHTNVVGVMSDGVIAEKVIQLLYNNAYVSLSNADIVITEICISEYYICSVGSVVNFDIGIKFMLIGIIRDGCVMQISSDLKLQINDKIVLAIKKRDLSQFFRYVKKINTI